MGITTKKKSEKAIPMVPLSLDHVKRDESGQIICPLRINPSLTILDFGEINWENPLFHSTVNFFPVGFKSVREHRSAKNPDSEKSVYTCSITEHEGKPLFTLECPSEEIYL